MSDVPASSGSLGRRRLLKGAAAVGIAAPLAALYARTRSAAGQPSPQLGPLVDDPAGILDLPAALTYRILQREGDAMDDGQPLPGKPDGMGCFAGPDDTWVLLRNHELSPALVGSVPEAPKEAFDPAMPGGVSRLVVNRADLSVRSSHLVLTGTDRNCAGGVSPWGWLSCEESVADGHGYVFVCPADAERLVAPQRVVGYGRYRHEAAAVVPGTHVCYLTEDRPDGCLYRFVPTDPAHPFEGRLQAMRVKGQPRFDTGHLGKLGTSLAIDWVDLDEPDVPEDTLRAEAHTLGAAIVRRGEGLIYDDGVIYACATSGGPQGAGQVFALDADGTKLRLLAASTDDGTLDHPDNVCIAPWGDVVVAEDGMGGNFLRGITPQGEAYDLARNALSHSEMAGVCFSPAGDVLFVNLQHDGLTLAITGGFPVV